MRQVGVVLGLWLSADAAAAATANVRATRTDINFNKALIDAECANDSARDISIAFASLGANTTPLPVNGQELVVWLSTNGCGAIPDDRNDPKVLLTTTTLPANLTTNRALVFPSDISGEELHPIDII